MNRIIDILMKRDGLSKEEARQQLENTKEMMLDAISAGDFNEVEEIMYSELGLEMDYIDDIL